MARKPTPSPYQPVRSRPSAGAGGGDVSTAENPDCRLSTVVVARGGIPGPRLVCFHCNHRRSRVSRWQSNRRLAAFCLPEHAYRHSRDHCSSVACIRHCLVPGPAEVELVRLPRRHPWPPLKRSTAQFEGRLGELSCSFGQGLGTNICLDHHSQGHWSDV